MKCYIKNCPNEACKEIETNGIFRGIYMENIKINVCQEHSGDEIKEALEIKGEEDCLKSQEVNPFFENVRKTS
jgi:hypothetical protein